MTEPFVECSIPAISGRFRYFINARTVLKKTSLGPICEKNCQITCFVAIKKCICFHFFNQKDRNWKPSVLQSIRVDDLATAVLAVDISWILRLLKRWTPRGFQRNLRCHLYGYNWFTFPNIYPLRMYPMSSRTSDLAPIIPHLLTSSTEKSRFFFVFQSICTSSTG